MALCARIVFVCLAAFAGCAPPSLETSLEDDETAVSSPLWSEKTIAGFTVVEGDMAFPAETMQTINAARASGVKRWASGIIPYVIEKALPQPDRITKAAQAWLDAGIRFVPRTNEADYVAFAPAKGCVSSTGRQGGRQVVWLAPGCGVSAVIHEMGHVIGLGHEQSRSDRDEHVTLHLENTDYQAQFKKTNFQPIGEYDVGSVMQYDSYAFSKNKQPTITRRDGKLIERSRAPSAKDIAAVRTYYAKELEQDNSDLGGDKTVELTWSQRSATATYSLDIGGTNDEDEKYDWWIAPCVGADILKKNLSVTFDGTCPSSKEAPKMNMWDITRFRICWTENDDWSRASCETVSYAGEPSVHVGP